MHLELEKYLRLSGELAAAFLNRICRSKNPNCHTEVLGTKTTMTDICNWFSKRLSFGLQHISDSEWVWGFNLGGVFTNISRLRWRWVQQETQEILRRKESNKIHHLIASLTSTFRII